MKPTKMNFKPAGFTAEDLTQTPAAQTTTRAWSPYQQAIFDFVVEGTGSAVVIAVAGSGKTTTIVEAANRLMASARVKSNFRYSATFVAFNKSIAEELKTRLPGSVRAQTLNSLGFGAWRRHLGDKANSLKLDANKTRQLTQDVIPPAKFSLFSKGMSRIIGIAKAIGLVPVALEGKYKGLVEDTDEKWVSIIEDYGIDVEFETDDEQDVAQFVHYAREILTKSIQMADSLIDFDDQLYMPVIAQASFWQNDFIFVDEAQDLNVIQRIMLKRALKSNGRLVAVGDPRQAIYAFRGADSSSIDQIKKYFNARELPLTISYRCPKAVVAEAQQWVSHIQSHETAKEGSVNHLDKYDASTFNPTDVIVCRNTFPLIEQAFALLRDGVPCKVRGRDIGAGLVALVKKFKTNDLDKFQTKLDEYVNGKVSKWIQDGKEELAVRLQDQFDTLQVFMESLEPGATVNDLTAKIESMFSDNGPAILTLSTIHKAKGLEFQRVFVLDAWLMPSKYARTPEAKMQEANLQYVAVTRAQLDLFYITSKTFKPGKNQKGGN